MAPTEKTPDLELKRRPPDMRRLGDHLDGAILGPDGEEVVKTARVEGVTGSDNDLQARGSTIDKQVAFYDLLVLGEKKAPADRG